MRSSILFSTTASCIFMSIIFICIAFATAIQQGDNDGSTTERARILINDSMNITVDVDMSNSDLSYVDISPSMTIRNAYAFTSSTTTVFFFWGRKRKFWDISLDDFVSMSFTSDGPFVPDWMEVPLGHFHNARRLYYYNGARDIAAGNVFTLFIENGAGRKELLRARMDDRSGFVEIPLILLDPGLSVGTRLAIVGWPELSNFYNIIHRNEDNHPICYLLSKNDKPPFEWGMLPSAQITLPMSTPQFRRVERIVCFRGLFDTAARQAWAATYRPY